MPGKDRQRQLAREKVQRQMARRAAQARRRRRLQAAAGSAVAVVAVVALAAFGAAQLGVVGDDNKPAAKATDPTCTYGRPAENRGPVPRKVKEPPTKDIVRSGTVPVRLATNQGELVLSLDRSKAPCTVNSFLSLVEQKYFDKTPCNRLTTEGIFVLQCGDPGGTGRGGPGYVFADEGLPADKNTPVTYPAGTVAMANAGPGTNGSQFFIVYRDTQFAPNYTIFGTLTKGLAQVQAVAKAGSTPKGDGKPNKPVLVQSAQALG